MLHLEARNNRAMIHFYFNMLKLAEWWSPGDNLRWDGHDIIGNCNESNLKIKPKEILSRLTKNKELQINFIRIRNCVIIWKFHY